ncbi:MAG: lipoyl(octanoyl) transferase LipB [Litorimonas sp.]
MTKSLYNSDLIEWEIAREPVPYGLAHERMKDRAAAIAAGEARELVWLLEHPPLYTAGTSANPDDLVAPDKFEVHQTGRGGQYTYHGPGQRVGYAMLDLRKRGRDVSAFVRGLEQWIIDALATFDVTAERRCGRVGVWVVRDNGDEEKIAAIGVRLKKWVSFHGISVNVDPNLSHFGGIVPCGISEHGVASLASLGRDATMKDVDRSLRTSFEAIFGPTLTT